MTGAGGRYGALWRCTCTTPALPALGRPARPVPPPDPTDACGSAFSALSGGSHWPGSTVGGAGAAAGTGAGAGGTASPALFHMAMASMLSAQTPRMNAFFVFSSYSAFRRSYKRISACASWRLAVSVAIFWSYSVTTAAHTSCALRWHARSARACPPRLRCASLEQQLRMHWHYDGGEWVQMLQLETQSGRLYRCWRRGRRWALHAQTRAARRAPHLPSCLDDAVNRPKAPAL